MTLVTAVKDYIEVVHKLIETSPNYVVQYSNYGDVLTILNFSLSTFKQICLSILSFEWLKQLWYFPILVPEIASSMVSEISILDGNFHTMLTFLDKPIIDNSANGNLSLPLICFEKLFTGLVNSLFIWIPTSTATFICFRRFIMQGVEAGFAAALGTMIANIFWLTSLLFGLRFIVVPWVSLDLFRYWLGFLLLMKYFWDNRFAYKEVKHTSVFGKKTLNNIFCFHFLLALTEQTSLYPFLSNFSISAQSTMLESFPSENFFEFSLVHISYLIGIFIGSYSIINLICWFWQDPAYRFYFWLMNKFKKLRVADLVRPIHLLFQSITVAFAFSSLPYFGIEYAITNPLGFLPNDQAFHQFKQTSFLTHPTSPTYYRSRLNFPNQKFFRYEDWAEYYHRNIPLDTSLYDQGSYRLYTMEDLNYGTDYEWIRRRSDKIKIRSRLKRLRWFPRNWANRLWEFTKTWSRRNVAWRNDILSTYQYSWDSKTPIIWGKLVREEFFPKFDTNKTSFKNPSDLNQDTSYNKNQINKTNKKINNNWGSFWGPDPDWASKFLWNQNSSNQLEKKFWWNWQSRRNLEDNNNWWKWINNIQSFSLYQSELPRTSTKFLTKQSNNYKKNDSSDFKMNREYNSDFWKPQDRLISLYLDKSKQKELTVELSTLRKFTRKLTARFKTSQLESNFHSILVNKNDFEGIALKMLLVVPQIKEWNSFQIVLNNINRVLWWSRLTSLNKSQSKKSWQKYNNINSNNMVLNDKNFKKISISTKVMDQKELTKNQSSIPFSKEMKIQQFLNWNNKDSIVNKKIFKFKKIQNKLNQLPELKKNFKIENNSLLLKNQTNLSIKNNFLKSNTDNFQNKTLNRNYSNTQKSVYFNSNLAKIKTLDITLLHPLNFYLHKEQNFKKKLRFYGVKSMSTKTNQFINQTVDQTKFPTENRSEIKKTDLPDSMNSAYDNSLANQLNKAENNNLPVFNFYMKTYFQNYKPTRLYVMNTKMKRQLGVSASARRKGRDYTNKLLKRSKILSGTPWIRQWVNQSGFLARRKRLETWIKRQHYDPNELWSKIMKADVDLFMSRQPSAHFLTNTEEKLLHLRRFLLFEHYDSLRWYTYMNHYRTMKNKIGGTKSFTSKLYNQQFKGTFHKVRHLFSLTPSSSNGSLLKFDQPLYNYENSNLNTITEKSTTNNIKLKNFSQVHEELRKQSLTNNVPIYETSTTSQISNDFIEESTKNLRNSILKSTTIRENVIKNILQQKDFDEFTNFLILKQNLNENNLAPQKLSFSNNSNFQKEFQNKKTSNFSNFIVNSRLKEKLRTKFMISLFQKRQKWTKDYKKTSEKLWKKWKLKILWLNRKNQSLSIPEKFNIPYETSFNTVTPVTEFMLKQNTKEERKFSVLTGKNLIDNDKFLLQNDSQKLYEIQKLKKLIEINQKNNINSLFYETNFIKINSLSTKKVNQNIFNNIKEDDENLEQPDANVKVLLKTAIRQSLKKAINIQTKSKTDQELPILLTSSSDSLKQLLELKQLNYKNTLLNLDKRVTKKVIQNIYIKALINVKKFKFQEMNSTEKLKVTKGPLYPKILMLMQFLKPEISYNKFWNYNLINKINNRNQHFFETNLKNQYKLKDLQSRNLQKNLILYKKNFILRERSTIQNYVLMKKILLNESSSSLTHHQIRPLPSTRAKTLYEKQPIFESISASNALKLVNTNNMFSLIDYKPLLGSMPSVTNKIHKYKNRKWLESHSIKKSTLDFRLQTLKKSKSIKDFNINFKSKDVSLLQNINKAWSLFLIKLQSNIGDIESNQMDLKIQNKYLQNQFLNLELNNKILNSQNSLNESNILINNKLSGTVFADDLGLSEIIGQKLSKVIQSKQKPTNAEIINRIRRTKQRRKRQKFSIKRNLLRRHLNRKNRRKLFLKTKEISNQRLALDRKYEIKERLFLTKIDQINSLFPQLEIMANDANIYTEKSYLKNLPNTQSAVSNIINSIDNESLYIGNKLGISSLKINSESRTSNLTQFGKVYNAKKLQAANFSEIETSKDLVDNFIVWLLNKEKTKNLRKENFLSKPDNTIIMKNLLDELNKENFETNKGSSNLILVNSEQISPNNFKRWWISKKMINNDAKSIKNSNKKQFSVFKSSDSYLSSLLRTSRYINKIITSNQTNLKMGNKISKFDLNSSYLTFKLNNNLNNINEVENEKNRLRRSLRKSLTNNVTNTQKNEWLKKLLKSEVVRDKWFFNKNQTEFSNKKNTKNIFLNNIALSTWVQKSSKTKKPDILKKILPLSVFEANKFIISEESKFNKLIEFKNKDKKDYTNFLKKDRFNLSPNDYSKNSTNLIDFNKYIITARTNPSKLSRQQIRKKTIKRRIIRTKRIERLKTLQDHPLKFRSDQIQSFYNIQNSLKKWKNFGFISSKLKFNDNLWKNMIEKNELLDNNLIVFSSNPFEKSLQKNFSSERYYKPLNSLKVVKTTQQMDRTNLIKNQIVEKKDNKTSSLNNLEKNANYSHSDLFYKLYFNIFVTGSNFEESTEIIDNNLQNNNIKNTPMNQIDLPKNEIESNDNFVKNQQKLLLNINPIPFYAGWDDTVRKFVITNRLLSRRDAGYNINLSIQNPTFSNLNLKNDKIDLDQNDFTENIEFKSWPLKGKNSATTLFSQFPFMTSPQTSLSYSSTQIVQLKGGTKYQKNSLNKFDPISKTNQFINNKWVSTSTEKFNITNSENLIRFKKEKRIKNQVKSNKSENQDRIRKYGQVISNVTIPAYRKNRRVSLFAPLRWRGKKYTTKSILIDTADITKNKQKLKLQQLFKNKTRKGFLVDKKTTSKISLLRTFKQGNRAQTRLPRIDRFLMLRRTSGSSWKNKISSSRRKKRRIKPIQSTKLMNKALNIKTTNKLVKEGGWETIRFIIKKRKKRGNNKNPRLRGDKNMRATKRQLRQKLYLRPKKRPLRRRSLSIHFQNKLNYWRHQSINISTQTNSKNSKQVNEISKNNNIKSFNKLNTSLNGRISFTKNLIENSNYAKITTEWNTNTNHSRQLYRSLFKNPSIHISTLYETLPAHSRSIPIIKNLPAPGSSVKTLNRVVKWNSADGASRFHRVNLAYGWALQLFLKNLQQKIKFKKHSIMNNKNLIQPFLVKDNNLQNSNNIPMKVEKNHLNDLTKILNTQSSHFSSARSFKRRSFKLRQLSYTMSMRLYDRWFFYYYSSKNIPFINKEKMENGLQLNFLTENKFNSSSFNEKRNLFTNLKKFLTFHLNDNQTSFRAYLKNLRIKAKKQADKTPQSINKKLTTIDNLESNLTENNSMSDTKLNKTLYDFKLFLNSNDQNNTDFNSNEISNKTLLKKEKKLQEDRFFFAQFNRPPLVDDFRITREVNRHYPLNGGFVWPGDYLRLKTIQLPKELIEEKTISTLPNINYLPYFYLQQMTYNIQKSPNSNELYFNSQLTNSLKQKKLPTYLDKWNTFELTQSGKLIDKLEIYNNIKAHTIENKINNLKQIFSNE
jgi:hypothetical protein